MPSIDWMPLESNPEVMNRFLETLGVSKEWCVTDVFSLDEELLPVIPTPSVAFLLLFPVGSVNMDQDKEQTMPENLSKDIYFLKQTVRNACGTVALIHAVANNVNHLKLDAGSVLANFIEQTKNMSPEDRGKQLENCAGIFSAHESSAQEGQTEVPAADADVNLHFVAFVNVGGKLYELDGRKDAPHCHGTTSEPTFIQDAAKVCQQFMARDPENVNFTILSLGPSNT